MIPIFSSDLSLGARSILNLDLPKKDKEGKYDLDIKSDEPVKLFQLCLKHEIKQLVLVESTPSSYWLAWENAEKLGIQLIYGLRLTVCADINDKSDASLLTESKIIVLFNNSQGYYDAVKLYTRAACDGYYYTPRICYKTLKELWTDNFTLAIDTYNSFLSRNTLVFGAQCVPDFPTKPIFLLQEQGLPYDELLKEKIEKYADKNDCPTLPAHWILYYKDEDILQYVTYACIGNRSKLEKPELPITSNQFSFESYLRRVNGQE